MDMRQMNPQAIAQLAYKMQDPVQRRQAATFLAETVGPSPDQMEQQQAMGGMMQPQQAPTPAPAPVAPPVPVADPRQRPQGMPGASAFEQYIGG